MRKLFLMLIVLLAMVWGAFAGSVLLNYEGVTLSYTWTSDKSLADDGQIKEAVIQGLKEGVSDGLKDKYNSDTTHYGDSYSEWSYRNSYVQNMYHDAYMQGYKNGAGKPPSLTDTIYW